ncbi:ABC transporter permease [Lachnotalea glycerini]|uniref:Sugar ABC transporter permease n=1 Tax=Lachnotalea glycerini TaxID=1763509 RepID=A0A371JEQ1_9FIRM|nr:ABC transporter permease subunit [Lachnotalea glycerini]RDY31213.1 sugar ABC transporter permease [Lachnotalea glycerini]
MREKSDTAIQKNIGKKKKKVAAKIYIRNNYQLYMMLVLPVIYLILFKYKPMIGVVAAFKNYNVFRGVWGSPWTGLSHFKEAFASNDFWMALKNTLILNVGDIIISFPIPIILALFLYELNSKVIKKSTQVILYLPYFFSWVIIAGIVNQLCSNGGMINNIITAFGGKSINFLTVPWMWQAVYWISGLWQGAGYGLIIYLAALSGADPSLGEAAYIDGAGRFKRIWYVTIPQIKGTISVMLIMKLGQVVSIGFDRPYMMSNTLVKSVSDVISTYVYSVGLQSARFDFATAVGLFQSVVGVLLLLIVNAMAKKFGEEGVI